MDAQAFKQFKEEILQILEGNEKLWGLKVQMERLISHVESELRTSVEHGRKITAMEDAINDSNDGKSKGIRSRVREHEEYLKEVKWLLRFGVGSVVALVIKAGWELITRH